MVERVEMAVRVILTALVGQAAMVVQPMAWAMGDLAVMVVQAVLVRPELMARMEILQRRTGRTELKVG